MILRVTEAGKLGYCWVFILVLVLKSLITKPGSSVFASSSWPSVCMVGSICSSLSSFFMVLVVQACPAQWHHVCHVYTTLDEYVVSVETPHWLLAHQESDVTPVHCPLTQSLRGALVVFTCWFCRWGIICLCCEGLYFHWWFSVCSFSICCDIDILGPYDYFLGCNEVLPFFRHQFAVILFASVFLTWQSCGLDVFPVSPECLNGNCLT